MGQQTTVKLENLVVYSNNSQIKSTKISYSNIYIYIYVYTRAYRPQRGRGHVTGIVLCVPSKIQIRQWFVTNYSNSCCLDCTMHTVDFTIFSLDLNFARCLVTCPLLL